MGRLTGPARTYEVIRYRREGQVGWLYAEPYNGAASTAFCGRLLDALRYAANQDTNAIALVGGNVAWSNGIHLGAIEAADDPRAEAWANIQRIDDVAELIFNLPRGRHVPRAQTTVAVLGSSAGAGVRSSRPASTSFSPGPPSASTTTTAPWACPARSCAAWCCRCALASRPPSSSSPTACR